MRVVSRPDPTQTQPALDGLPRPRVRRFRSAGPLAETRPVARCVVDRPVPHLDRVFEYGVPASMDAQARPGVRVRVRFGGQDVDAFLVDRVEDAEHDGELAPLRRVVSGEMVLTPVVLELARRVAARWAGTVPDVLRLAVPPRHARTETEPWETSVLGAQTAVDVVQPAPSGGASPRDGTSWAHYAGGPAFLHHVVAGGAPRAVWSALPGPDAAWALSVAEAVAAARRGGRGSLVVVATAADVDDATSALERCGVAAWRPGVRGGWVRLVADDGPSVRYRAFLAVVRGEADVVVGTRAAAFAPVRDLGLVVCWDEADPLHAEQRAPYPHAREVLGIRSELEGCALLVGGYVRSTAAQRWVEEGSARAVQADRAVVRRRAPRVRWLDAVDLAAEGPAAAARLPGPAWRVVRDALERGPVLVQVPRAGYLPVVACGRCRAVARCASCHGPLRVQDAGGTPSCRWCGRLAAAWRCPECGADHLRSVRVGSDRTAEELGRAFPGVPVRVSGATAEGGVAVRVPGTRALVVATPGAEPRAQGGYAAAVLLDAAVVTGRDALDVGEQALRTWARAAALVRAAEDGGAVVVVGAAAPRPVQALVRWDPGGFAARELAERRQLSLPPAVHVAVLDGPRNAVVALLERVDLPAGSDVLGPLAVPAAPPVDDGVVTLLDLAEEQPVRALVRTPWAAAPEIAARLVAAQATRSARRESGGVRIQLEPNGAAL